MILPNWLESITLEIFENASEEETNICIDYWSMNSGVFKINTSQILKKYDIENIHKLIFIVNTNSRFFHANKCSKIKCNNTHSFHSRTEFNAGINVSGLTKNFINCDNSKYRKTTSIIELFEKEKWYCNKCTKKSNHKREIQKQTEIYNEWLSIKKSYERLSSQLERHSLAIARFIRPSNSGDLSFQILIEQGKKPREIEKILSNRNYLETFTNDGHILNRKQSWLLFCDYWQFESATKWQYLEVELCKKYKIKISELESMVQNSGDFMPLIYEKLTDELIKSRDDYLTSINDVAQWSDRDNLNKFNDTKELSDMLREIAKTSELDISYTLKECATHMDGLYSHYKELVNRGF